MDNKEIQAGTDEKTWFESAEAEEGSVEYGNYPLWVVIMALTEQQKRTSDALERIALATEWFVYGLHEAPDESMSYWLANVRRKIQKEKE